MPVQSGMGGDIQVHGASNGADGTVFVDPLIRHTWDGLTDTHKIVFKNIRFIHAYVADARVEFENCVFKAPMDSNRNAALQINSTVDYNDSRIFGGIPHVTLKTCVIRENNISGLYIKGPSTVPESNSPSYLHASKRPVVTLIDTEISDNIGYAYGGVSVEYADLHLQGTTVITRNTISNLHGPNYTGGIQYSSVRRNIMTNESLPGDVVTGATPDRVHHNQDTNGGGYDCRDFGTYRDTCQCDNNSHCGSGQYCANSVCEYCNGCLNSQGQCQGYNNQGSQMCGNSGQTCGVCPERQACDYGMCIPCSECLTANGICAPGNRVDSCGSGGNLCVECPAGKMCMSGSCVTPPEHDVCASGCVYTSIYQAIQAKYNGCEQPIVLKIGPGEHFLGDNNGILNLGCSDVVLQGVSNTVEGTVITNLARVSGSGEHGITFKNIRFDRPNTPASQDERLRFEQQGVHVVDNCVFDNSALGISIQGSAGANTPMSVTIKNTTFYNTDRALDIPMGSKSNVMVENSTFSDNGGVVHITSHDPNHVTLKNCTIENIDATDNPVVVVGDRWPWPMDSVFNANVVVTLDGTVLPGDGTSSPVIEFSNNYPNAQVTCTNSGLVCASSSMVCGGSSKIQSACGCTETCP
jgi:hypothetical protein